MARPERGEKLDLITAVIGQALDEPPGLQVLGNIP
jgi:hypothetical protein